MRELWLRIAILSSPNRDSLNLQVIRKRDYFAWSTPQDNLHSYRFEQLTAHCGSSLLVLNLHDHFGFNRRIVRKRGDADGCTRMLAALAPEFDEKI